MVTSTDDRHRRTLDRHAVDTPLPDDRRWNHSIEHHVDLLRMIPAGVPLALDVGCGDGQLTRRLATIAEHAVGLDHDAPSVGLAAEHSVGTRTSYVRGDLLAAPFPPATFDAVTCVMALHHVDTEAGLHALADLVAPGGTLGIIGCGRSDLPWDLPYEVAGAVSTRLQRRVRGLWEQTSPMVWPPPDTYRQTRRAAERILPGCTFRRTVLWRYVLTWTKPHRPPGR